MTRIPDDFAPLTAVRDQGHRTLEAAAAAAPAIVAHAREWLAICAENDATTSTHVAEMTADQVIGFTARHWGGGLPVFLRQCRADILIRHTEATGIGAITTGDPVDFVVLHDGPAGLMTRHTTGGAGQSTAIGQWIPNRAPYGVGRVNAWHADDFGAEGLYQNLLADRVLRGIGDRHDIGFWRGPVAVTMAGRGPLSDDVLATLAELADRVVR